MLVFHNHRLVILSVPKTGNTALETALAPHASLALQGPPALRHMPWRVYRNRWAPFLREQFGTGFETLAILRDPLDRMRSWYRYRARKSFEASENATSHLSFDQFIEASLRPDPPSFARIWTQDKFVSSRKEEVRVTHLFDYAQLDLAVDWLSKRLKREIALQPKNISPSRSALLSVELEAELRDARAREFALYAQVAEHGYLRTR